MTAREWKPGDRALVEVEVTWTDGEGDVQCSIGDDEGYFLPVNVLRPVGDVLHRQPGRSEAEIKAEALQEAAKDPALRLTGGGISATRLLDRASRLAGTTEAGDES